MVFKPTWILSNVLYIRTLESQKLLWIKSLSKQNGTEALQKLVGILIKTWVDIKIEDIVLIKTISGAAAQIFLIFMQLANNKDTDILKKRLSQWNKDTT